MFELLEEIKTKDSTNLEYQTYRRARTKLLKVKKLLEFEEIQEIMKDKRKKSE